MIHTPYFIKSNQKKPIQNRIRTSIPTFLMKTYEMLENQDHKDIVCWSEDGKSFLIKKLNDFRDQVLPQYFKHNNYSSFVRQLNMYDFHKVRNETTDYEYKNPLFQRGQQKKMSEIKRKSGDSYFGDEFSNLPAEGGNDSNNENAVQNNGSGANSQLEGDQTRPSQQQDSNNNTQFISEVVSFKSKQQDLEKAMMILIQQHETLIKENKFLWDEIRKQSEQDEVRSNKLLTLLAFFFSHINSNSGPSSQMGGNNSNNNSNQFNANRILSLSQLNHKPFNQQPEEFDLASFLQPQSYRKDELFKLMSDINTLRSGALPADSLTMNNSSTIPVFPLPLNRKQKGGDFPANISKQQIQKLFEHYQNGDKQNQELIAQYLQGVINNTNSKQSDSSNKIQNKFNNYQLQYFEPNSPTGNSTATILHEKPIISVFENTSLKRICDDNDPNSKMFRIQDSHTQSKLEQIQHQQQQQQQQSQSYADYLLNNNSNNKNLDIISNNNLNNNLLQLSRVNSINNPQLLASLSNNGNINNHNNNNNQFNIPLFSEGKYFSESNNQNQNQGKYSPSPLRRDLDNANILHSPTYFANGSLTPIDTYSEDESYFMRSRHNSFHLPELKSQDPAINNFPSIN